MCQNLLSAAVVIGALRVNKFTKQLLWILIIRGLNGYTFYI